MSLMSPILPYLTEWKEIIEIAKDYIDEFWFENLNLRGLYKTVILNYIKEKYFPYYDKYKEIYINRNMTYFEELAKEIDKHCINNNIKYINYFYHSKLVEEKKNKQKKA